MVALRYPDRVTAVGLHSGVVVGAADNPRAGLKAMLHGSSAEPAWLLDAAGATPGGPELPAIVVHGLDDDAVHPVNGRLLARQFLAYNQLEDRLAAFRTRGSACLPGISMKRASGAGAATWSRWWRWRG